MYHDDIQGSVALLCSLGSVLLVYCISNQEVLNIRNLPARCFLLSSEYQGPGDLVYTWALFQPASSPDA